MTVKGNEVFLESRALIIFASSLSPNSVSIFPYNTLLSILKSNPFHIDGLLYDRYNLSSALFQTAGAEL
jgi:hypothetical protein